jgi:peptidoglycan hydrolase-like protein with peptidoglycan-binding domain
MLNFFHCQNSKKFLFLISSLFLISPLFVSATIVNNLSVGSQGEEVRELQTKLIGLGYLTTTATGYFGQATKNAVIQYQKDNTITSSGYVGPITRASLQTTTTNPVSQENREIPKKLFVTIVGNGTVTSPSGINCSAGTCVTDYPRALPGTSVTLTASPASGQKFSGWSDSLT